jgi:UDP-4-amino-4-deoxy-L-arabinose-oxoglutarate aminotransferase
MRGLRRIANEHGLKIIEDAAHCVEGVRDGIRPGELSEAVCFSFFATKNLACGEGGAAVCDNEPLAESLRLLRLHGMNKTSADREREGYQHWDMPSFGWKYNMDNIHAAMLLPQIPLIERRWQMRQTVAEWYFDEFENLKEVSWPSRLPGCKHANHLFTIWVDPERRDALIAHLKCRGISSVVNYRPIHLLTYFKDSLGTRQGMFPNAERIGASTISLPFFVSITREQVARVAREIRAFFRNRQPAS